ncbi:hypothetical protein DFH09DRAFT_37451 [Mycena vulgaris]|nr:hypothetical protein DFH09DRAFT_37451 [Mycena vulgaris]
MPAQLAAHLGSAMSSEVGNEPRDAVLRDGCSCVCRRRWRRWANPPPILHTAATYLIPPSLCLIAALSHRIPLLIPFRFAAHPPSHIHALPVFRRMPHIPSFYHLLQSVLFAHPPAFCPAGSPLPGSLRVSLLTPLLSSRYFLLLSPPRARLSRASCFRFYLHFRVVLLSSCPPVLSGHAPIYCTLPLRPATRLTPSHPIHFGSSYVSWYSLLHWRARIPRCVLRPSSSIHPSPLNHSPSPSSLPCRARGLPNCTHPDVVLALIRPFSLTLFLPPSPSIPRT